MFNETFFLLIYISASTSEALSLKTAFIPVHPLILCGFACFKGLLCELFCLVDACTWHLVNLQLPDATPNLVSL